MIFLTFNQMLGLLAKPSLPGTTGNTFSGSINGGQNFSHKILVEGISLGLTELAGGTSTNYSPARLRILLSGE